MAEGLCIGGLAKPVLGKQGETVSHIVSIDQFGLKTMRLRQQRKSLAVSIITEMSGIHVVWSSADVDG
jgi:hypothetical protein